jgi:hypothetical protein
MKKIFYLVMVFCLVSTLSFAGGKGDFTLGAGYKNISFDTPGDMDATLYGASLNFHTKLMEFSGVNSFINFSAGYYYGKIDDSAGFDPNISDIPVKLGVGVGYDLGKFDVGVDLNATYDHIDVDSLVQYDPFGVGGDIYINYNFETNNKFGIKAEYTKFFGEDELDSSYTISLVYGFNFK